MSQGSKSPDPPVQIAIIGSGSAAFACAIKATENGAKVTIIERGEDIGGCCVNVGCVPSKILIRAAQLAEQQRDNPFYGLENQTPVIDRSLLSKQQLKRVDELRHAKYQNILNSNPSLSLISGWATFKDANTLQISMGSGKVEEINADKILIAAGSQPSVPSIPGLQNTPYWTSTEALFAEELPEHLVVIGSSVVAVELAQAYRRLSSKVSILARHNLLYREEPLLGEQLKVAFEKENISIFENCQAQKINHDGSHFHLITDQGKISCDRLLIATGRKANTTSLNLRVAGIETDATEAIKVNSRCQTNISHIYAAGDCTDHPQFVYVAAAAGSRAGANMTGGNVELDLSCVPAVTFTDPQVATVGLTEAAAIHQQIEVESRVLDLGNVPRALVNFNTHGFIKLVANKSSGKLLGAQVLAQDAGEVIQSAAMAINNDMSVKDIANQLFPYLTMVEGLKLCAQTFHKDVSQLSCCAG